VVRVKDCAKGGRPRYSVSRPSFLSPESQPTRWVALGGYGSKTRALLVPASMPPGVGRVGQAATPTARHASPQLQVRNQLASVVQGNLHQPGWARHATRSDECVRWQTL
jgi:hypothetical protein